MARSGLLILTQPLGHLRGTIPSALEQASKAVSDTLYICLQPMLQLQPISKDSLLQPVASTTEVQAIIKDLYMSGSKACLDLDIRVLLSHICPNPTAYLPVPYCLPKTVSFLLTDSHDLQNIWSDQKVSIMKALENSFGAVRQDIELNVITYNSSLTAFKQQPSVSTALKTFPNVVLGGTFDRLHSGHKWLLSESCLHTDRKLTVGITDGDRNKSKILWELMEPYSTREEQVVKFVNEVKPSIVVEPVKIFDAFGPTITDPDLQCIVVSEETKEGGRRVNEERLKLGFQELELITVDLVEDVCHGADEELKVSSSSTRKRLLGTLLRPLPERSGVPRHPYRIAVTGGIASGKSNVCSELTKFGATVVNCDLLGHKAYVKGTPAYHQIVQSFSVAVLDDNGDISRPKLGAVVFSDKSKLTTLNNIVWPVIRQLAEKEMEAHGQAGVRVVVLEAAVLLEAGWDDMVHEVWSTFIPRQEALKRLMERNGLSQEDAEKRINAQMSNTERIERSNVVLCPQWEFEVTRKQVQRAWDSMQQRIQTAIS